MLVHLQQSALDAVAIGPSWLDPERLISAFGLLGILLIVFAECGLLLGFFLPGDSLLFVAGCSWPRQIAAALDGGPLVGWSHRRQTSSGYAIGGAPTTLFKRPNSRLFGRVRRQTTRSSTSTRARDVGSLRPARADVLTVWRGGR